jgi:hypothetical protein
LFAGRETHPECQLARLERNDTRARVDVLAEDLFRFLRRDFLDVHSTGGTGDDDRARRRTIDDDAQIELAFDLESFFDQDASDFSAFRSGLVRDERHAEHLLGELLGLVGGLGDLDAAALATPAGMDLRLDDGNVAAQTFGDRTGFLGGEGHFAARNGHTEARQH